LVAAMFDIQSIQGWHRSRRAVALTSVERELDGALAAWRAFMAVRRDLDRQLKAYRVSFAQWRVLYVTERLVREYESPVGQMEIAGELDMDEGGISGLLERLLRAGLVDIEPEYWRTLNGVLLTPRGKELLGATREIVRCALGDLLPPLNGIAKHGDSASE
jgi:DNA-binding MarR family transcriptional regulator